MFSGIEGLTREPVQCEFIDSESNAANDISVSLISVNGLKKFTVKEEFREGADKREHITTVYYNTSRNCRVLQERQAGVDPVFEYSSNPVFDDPSLPEAVRKLAMNHFKEGLATISIDKIPDMNHDGQDDFIAQGGSGYCGSAGCAHLLVQSVKTSRPSPGGPTYGVAFEGHVHGIEFPRDTKSKVVFTASMHGSACGKSGSETCRVNFVLFRNKYMSEQDVIALTEIIPAERTAFCGLVNAQVLDKLKRVGGRNDVPTFQSAYRYYEYYRDYLRKNHLKNFSYAYLEKVKAQVLELPDPRLIKALTECNSDRRVTAQRTSK
jgi:hypothetical protein